MLGVLVLANFGTLDSLTLSGVRVGPALGKLLADPPPQVDAGSVIIIIACDRALDSRQLNASPAERARGRWVAIGMAPAISRWRFPPGCWEPRYRTKGWSRFLAAADATEYAVLDALLSAEGVSGFQQHARAAPRCSIGWRRQIK